MGFMQLPQNQNARTTDCGLLDTSGGGLMHYYAFWSNPDDPRLDASYVYGGFMRGNSLVKVYPDNANSEGFPYIKKHIDPAFISNTTNRNFIYLRYADVLKQMN